MLSAYTQGFALGGSLIVAIGAQNAFVLTQAVRKNHHFAVATVCALCDIVLLGVGVAGVGAMVAANPAVGTMAAWGGAIFLGWYGFGAFRSVLRGGQLKAGEQAEASLQKTLAVTLAVTLLNPHVYLDTVVLMGSISGQYPASLRWVFGLGAMSASVVWFYFLCLGGRAIAPLFSKDITWRILDGAVCLTMWSIGAMLLHRALTV